jgi:hypothetical protein
VAPTREDGRHQASLGLPGLIATYPDRPGLDPIIMGIEDLTVGQRAIAPEDDASRLLLRGHIKLLLQGVREHPTCAKEPSANPTWGSLQPWYTLYWPCREAGMTWHASTRDRTFRELFPRSNAAGKC